MSWLVGFLHYFPLGVTRAYAHLHMGHHKNFGVAESDPDYQTYREYPVSRLDFLLIALKHLTGFSTVRQLLSWREKPAQTFNFDKIFVVLFQLSLIGVAVLSGRWWGYFIFWALPIVTIVKFLGYLRIVAEHGEASGKFALRNFLGAPVLCSVLGPFGFRSHGEHHLRPNLPYQVLLAEAPGSSGVENYPGSHFHFWFHLLKRLPWVKSGV
jgi:fatty acid desaturase